MMEYKEEIIEDMMNSSSSSSFDHNPIKTIEKEIAKYEHERENSSDPEEKKSLLQLIQTMKQQIVEEKNLMVEAIRKENLILEMKKRDSGEQSLPCFFLTHRSSQSLKVFNMTIFLYIYTYIHRY